jgi:hypothetical protein
MAMAGKDRRRDQRFGCHMELWVCPGGSKEFYLAEVYNVSASGMLIRVDFPLALEENLHCKVELPQFQDLIEFRASVRFLKAEAEGESLAGIEITETVEVALKTFKAQLEAMFL